MVRLVSTSFQHTLKQECTEKQQTTRDNKAGAEGRLYRVPYTAMDSYIQIDGAPSRNRTGKTLRSADFKSAVFTNFTIGAMVPCSLAWTIYSPQQPRNIMQRNKKAS